MVNTQEQSEYRILWDKYFPGVSPAYYLHRFHTLTDAEVTENLRWDIEKLWKDHHVDLQEDEHQKIINKRHLLFLARLREEAN